MSDVECASCGTSFDTDRDTGEVYKNPRRCPYCGTVAVLEDDQDDGDEPAPATATVATGEGTVVRVTVEIDPAG
jgi:NAD-dependent SIR2 family protein deacetylase